MGIHAWSSRRGPAPTALLIVALLAPGIPGGERPGRDDGLALQPEALLGRLARRPVDFVANRGQWPQAAHFAARRGPSMLWCERDGWTLDRRDGEGRGIAVRMRFQDVVARPAPVGEVRRPGRHAFLRGGSPHGPVAGAPAFGRLRWTNVWPGVDVVARGRGADFEYDLELAPGADPSRILLACEGIESLRVDEQGALVLETALGELRQPPPLTWQALPSGELRQVPCAYVLRGPDSFGFVTGPREPEARLVIDPVLEWSTFLGSTHMDAARALTVDALGRLTLVGTTHPSAYPLTPGAYDTSFNGTQDGFVTCLSADGSSLLFSTLLGGSGDDELLDVAADGSGGFVVTGWTASPDFPTTGGAAPGVPGGAGALASDAFVACLDGTGSSLVFARILGGSGDDVGRSLVAGPDGRLWVAGWTASHDFPVTAGPAHGGGSVDGGDAFLAGIDGAGNVFASRLLGGAADDLAHALALDGLGRPVLAGWSASADLPVTDGSVRRGPSDAFVAVFAGDDLALEVCRRLGGQSDDAALAIDVDAAGRLLVAGTSRSPDFACVGPMLQPGYAGGAFHGDAWLARLPVDGPPDFASLLGGSGDDVPLAVASVGADDVFVAGWTTSGDWPLSSDALDGSRDGSSDAFVARVDLAAGVLVHSTYMGGQGLDRILGLAVGPQGRLLVAGLTTSADFPVTAGSLDPVYDGLPGWVSESFVSSLDLGRPGRDGVERERPALPLVPLVAPSWTIVRHGAQAGKVTPAR